MTDHSPHQVPTLFYILVFIAMGYLIYNLRRLFTVRIGRAEDMAVQDIPEIIAERLWFSKIYQKNVHWSSAIFAPAGVIFNQINSIIL